MARPIKPTPALNERKSRKFLATVAKDLKAPTHKKDVSRVMEAKKIAVTHAVLGPK